MGSPPATDPIPPTHAPRIGADGQVTVGSLYMVREIGRRTTLNRDQATEAWHAALDALSVALMSGATVRFSNLVRIRLGESAAGGRTTRRHVRLRGKVSRQAKALWWEIYGDDEDDDGGDRSGSEVRR